MLPLNITFDMTRAIARVDGLVVLITTYLNSFWTQALVWLCCCKKISCMHLWFRLDKGCNIEKFVCSVTFLCICFQNSIISFAMSYLWRGWFVVPHFYAIVYKFETLVVEWSSLCSNSWSGATLYCSFYLYSSRV